MFNLPTVITISRQLGSGGAYLGQQLVEQLGILYLDREIVIQAAKQLRVLEEDLKPRDEKKHHSGSRYFNYPPIIPLIFIRHRRFTYLVTKISIKPNQRLSKRLPRSIPR